MSTPGPAPRSQTPRSKLAPATFDGESRVAWVLDYLAQVVQVTFQIMHTRETEAALSRHNPIGALEALKRERQDDG